MSLTVHTVCTIYCDNSFQQFENLGLNGIVDIALQTEIHNSMIRIKVGATF